MRVRRALWLVPAVVLVAAPAAAQVSFDSVGARGLGMAGAFVAVADDPTATHWNPAGLVKGGPAGLTIGLDGFQIRNLRDLAQAGTQSSSARMIQLGTWPLGLSVGRIEAQAVRSSAGLGLWAESLSINQFGVTVLQTLADADVGAQRFSVVAGATVKYLRGTARIVSISQDLTVDDAFDRLEAAPGAARGTLDIDVGVLAELGRVRAGLTLKNLRQPTFRGVAGNEIRVQRRARMGVSVAARDGVTLALDVDLDTADPLVGLRQVIALGGESRLGSRLALRGGMRWQRAGGRPIGAVGGSLRIRQSLWLDGYATAGRRTDQGFGMALRAGL